MSKTQNIDILGLLNHIILCAPDFPDEERTNLGQEFGKLRAALEARRAQSGADARKWLGVAISEVETAFAAYSSGDEDKALHEMHSAESHFKDYLKGQSIRPRFVASPGGAVEDRSREH